MYIRTKTRKNKSGDIREYAYLVFSKRRKKSKKSPKQRVSKYLGRVIELFSAPKQCQSMPINANQCQSMPINAPLNPTEAVKSLFETLLLSAEFQRVKKETFRRGDVEVDLFGLTVKSIETGQKLCIQANEGFISDYTLRKIVRYRPPETTEKEIGQDLAKRLLASGLKPSQEVFLALYYQILKNLHRK